MLRLSFLFSVLGLAAAGAVFAADPPVSETAPSDPAQEMLRRMAPLFDVPDIEDIEARKAETIRRMKGVGKALEEFEGKFPDSEHLAQARVLGVVAAVRLARLTGEAKHAAEAQAIVAKVAASDASVKHKLTADAQTLPLALLPRGAATSRPSVESIVKAIEAFVDRHAGTDHARDAILIAMNFAGYAGDPDLVTALEKRLVEKFPDKPFTKQILRRQGKSPDVGKPFEADLTLIGGKKLNLPGDLKGKVFVVDFWATWCGPCVAEVPEMKKIYAEYKPVGVEFVGISLDTDVRQMTEFVQKEGMNWLHSCTGKRWDDPTFKKLGLEGIPSVWVVGKDGRVVSDNARGKLAETIKKALADSGDPPSSTP